MNDKSLITTGENFPEFTRDQIELIKNTVCKGASDEEFKIFLHICQKTGLDPFMKQIYSIPRGGQRTIQTSIDGLRLIAERTGKYAPGRETTYIYKDNQLFSATAYIKKMTMDGTWHEISATAVFNEYYPANNTFWKKMPHVMLAKCAESQALKKAFPYETSGVYSREEMAQADVTSVVEIVQKKEETMQEKEEIVKQFIFELLGEESTANLSQDEIDTILAYSLAYSNNLKKTMRESLETYQDRDKFMKHVHIWKERQKKVDVA